MTKKVAVVLFNLGGPDSLSSVKSFLFNLFYDPAIIQLPNPFRWFLAKFISAKREKESKWIYSQMGGKSPILSLTRKQGSLLEVELNNKKKEEYKVFVSMRYWHPMADEVMDHLVEFSPDEIILLPLYPQYSTTTTKSSFDQFKSLLKKSSLKEVRYKKIYSYFNNSTFIKSHVELIKKQTNNIKGKYRILFSAHGLPKRLIKNGDPYQIQIEQTVKNIIQTIDDPTIDYSICYQSKVGPLEWIKPSTQDEIMKAAKEDISVVIVPVAFVSEHSETLVELDIEYKKIFIDKCNKSYIRIDALNDNIFFIQSLVEEVCSKIKEK